MAEGKNSFLLYKDIVHTLRKVVAKDRANKTNYSGELFLHIAEYVNDTDPETDDIMLEILFEPIKQQLKRDLKKYEQAKNKKSESGRVGNLKRWHKELFDKYSNGEISLEESEAIANSRTCDKSIANIAVSDSVTVSDSVSDILLEKETKHIHEEKIETEITQPQKPKQEKKEKSSAKKEITVRFVPPTVQQVADYCASRQNNIKPENFVDFYKSKGWRVGKNPMKDWQAAVRTWENNNRNSSVSEFSQRINGKPPNLNERENKMGRITQSQAEAFLNGN